MKSSVRNNRDAVHGEPRVQHRAPSKSSSSRSAPCGLLLQAATILFLL